jgi:hypothetical protein
MKKTILAALIAVTGSIALNNAVAAPLYDTTNAPISYTAGNIFIGFRANKDTTGADKSYLLNLGNYGNFPILKAGDTPVELFDVGSQLVTVYGANWYASNTVTWGIFGIDSSKLPIYSSTSDDRGNTPITRNVGQAAGAWTAYTGMGGSTGYNGAIANGASTGSTTGVLGNGVVTGIGNNTWWKNIDAAADFGVYNSTIEAGVNTDLEFYSTSASAATRLTQFNISGSGVISVVPEPSTYALLGLGALVVIVAYRRKAKA